MKTSTLILQAIRNEGGTIKATQFDEWLGQLKDHGYIENETKNDTNVFYWKLTEKAIQHLSKN